MNKVVRNGKVAALISPGYGAGWSTWADDKHAQTLLFDERFVKAAEDGVKDIGELVEEIFGADTYVCTLGWHSIRVVWLDEGTHFTVNEYDGSESIKFLSDISIVA